jgi:hypothetical protein
MVIVQYLSDRLPARYVAAPHVHLGGLEVDVATYDHDIQDNDGGWTAPVHDGGNDIGHASTNWSPSAPTLAVATDLPASDEYEVRVYDTKRGRRLVAVIEIVSPANKDRPEHRSAFVTKCAALLQDCVSVIIVDIVTVRRFNLYDALLDQLGHSSSTGEHPAPLLYSAACRATKNGRGWLLETWAYELVLGDSLPTVPLWLADNFAVPLELEVSYEPMCRSLRIP